MSGAAAGGDSSRPWEALSSGFEQARAREDSLDRLVEWPAQRALLGDVTGLAVLDAGCGNGAKIAELAGDGAAASVGVDISGNFIEPPPGVELIEGDLSDLAAVPGLAGRRFDRILFLQSFGTPRSRASPASAREMLTEDGFILLTGPSRSATRSNGRSRTAPRWVRSTSPPSRSPTAMAAGTTRSRSPSGRTRCRTCSTRSARPGCGSSARSSRRCPPRPPRAIPTSKR